MNDVVDFPDLKICRFKDKWNRHLRAGFYYYGYPVYVLVIINDPKGTVERTITAMTHEYLHHLFEVFLEPEISRAANSGLDAVKGDKMMFSELWRGSK